MRAKVAKNAGGHALEKRFLDLDEIQLALLYTQAVNEENEEKKEHFETIKILNEAWTKKFDNHFETLQVFSNIELYKKKLEMKKTQEYAEEISEDNFLEEWDKIMAVIPEEYVVDEPDAMENLSTVNDPEFDDLVTGWVQNSKKNNIKE